jgi:hypothetical protein
MSNELIRAMFKHLVKTYTVEQTKDILSAKFPTAVDLISGLSTEDFKMEEEVVKAKKERMKAEPKKVVEKKPRSKVSKKDQAMKMYTESADKSRGYIISLIMNEMQVSKAYASNLYHTCKKELG